MHHHSEKELEQKAYLIALRKVKKELFYPVLTSVHEEVFTQTDCLSCAKCCKTIPALLTRSDIKRLAAHLNLPPKTFVRKYVLEDIQGELTLNGVPCTFLNSDNTCSVYDIRPEACRRYPHTDEVGYIDRTALNLANAAVCPAADEILTRLQKSFPLP
jgi:Fe-S-cluster containining protein